MPERKTNRSKKTDNSTESSQSEKIMNSAQKMVSSAVNVLEEEIAAGILAAKKLENKLIDVEEVRSNQDELMNRIRRDTHEAVDLFLDAFAALTQQLNGFIEKEKKNSTTEEKSTNAKTSTKKTSSEDLEAVVLQTETPLKPGESTEFELLISEEVATKISLQKSDLQSTGNKKINLRNIIISPSEFTLKPKVETEIKIQIKVPKTAVSGHYHTLITDQFNPKIRIILSIEIAE